MPTRHDVSLWRGNSAPPIVWTLPEDLAPGAAFFLAVEADGRILLSHDTPAGTLVLNAEAGTLTWSPGPAETRLVPEGRVARYELELRAGGVETTLFFGAMTGLGGANLDGEPLSPAALDGSEPGNSPSLLSGWL